MKYALKIAFAICLCAGLARAQNTPIVSGTVTLQVLGGQRVFTILLNQNVTSFSINAPGVTDGTAVMVAFTQNSTGGYTVGGYATNIQNSGAITIATSAGAISTATIIYSAYSNVWAVVSGGGGGGSMTWPSAAGVANYSGSSSWGASYVVGTAANDLVQLNGSGQLPAVSAANLTALPSSASLYPTLNQSTIGNAATATALAATPLQCGSNQVATGIAASGNANCTSFGGGTVVYTGSQTLAAANSNELVAMNCSSACTVTLPATPPSSYWNVAIQWQQGAAGPVSIAPGGPNLYIASTTATTSAFQIPTASQTIYVTTDGTSYYAEAPLLAGTNVTLTPGTSGLTLSSSGGSGGLPSGWSQNGTTYTVQSTTASTQDAPILQLTQQVSAGTSDLQQWYLNGATPSSSCSTNAKCIASIGPGGLYLAANSFNLGSVNQSSASYLSLFGGTPAQPYINLSSAALNPPAQPTVTDCTSGDATPPCTGTSGTLAASTVYTIEVTYLNAAGETTVSTAQSVTTSAASTDFIVVTSPAGSTNATGYHAYMKTSGNYFLQNGSGGTALGTNAVITSFNNSAPQPPSGNTTGGAFNSYLSMSAEGGGVLCSSSSVPGADCASGNQLVQASGLTFANMVSGSTISAAQIAASPVTNDCPQYNGTTMVWFACGSWSSLTAPSANLSLNITGFTSAWSSTTASSGGTGELELDPNANLDLSAVTAATSSKNYSSPYSQWYANYWTGTASATDNWYVNNSCNTGSNPLCNLVFGHGGSPSGGTIEASLGGLNSKLVGYSAASSAPTSGDCASFSGNSANIQDSGSGCGGNTPWNNIGTPTGNLSLTMGSNTSTFNSSLTSTAFTWQQSTAATSGANQDSPALVLGGTVWNGSASVANQWSLQDQPAATGTSSENLVWNYSGPDTNVGMNVNGHLFAQPSAGFNGANLILANAPSGFSGNLLNLELNSTGVFTVSSGGSVSVGANLHFTSSQSHIQQNSANSDIAGTISISSSTSGSHTFAVNYSSAPVCTVTQQGLSASPTVYFGVGVTTSTLTVYASTSGTYTVGYICIGNPN